MVKRRDEILVGATILLGLVLTVGGAIWLSQSQLGGGGEAHRARFRSVGGLGVGDPVVLRGVRVGRVKSIRLGPQDVLDSGVIVGTTPLPPLESQIASERVRSGKSQAN